MVTRSVIQVVGCTDLPPDQAGAYSGAARLYRHTDGGPWSCLPDIARAIEMMERLVKASLHWKQQQVRHIAVEPMAQAIVASTMSNYMLAAMLEKLHTGTPRLLHLGDQSDLEWLYVVDCKSQLVNLYSAKQGDAAGRTCQSATPREHLEAGFFSTAEQVFRKEWRPEFVDTALAEYADGVKAVASTGWSFNEWEDPYLRLVRRAARKTAAAVAEPAVTEPQVVSAFCI